MIGYNLSGAPEVASINIGKTIMEFEHKTENRLKEYFWKGQKLYYSSPRNDFNFWYHVLMSFIFLKLQNVNSWVMILIILIL